MSILLKFNVLALKICKMKWNCIYIRVKYLVTKWVAFSFLILTYSCTINSNAPTFSNDAMPLGVKVDAPTPQPEKYLNDLIHPCIRFIPGGFAGHHWWMIASPFPNHNVLVENPILYYGDEDVNGAPPLKWTAVGVIEDTPPVGSLSDPGIYFDGSGLWCYWRENDTSDCHNLGYRRVTFGKFSQDGRTFGPKKFFAGETSESVDHELCPIICKVNGQVRLYGSHHKFKPEHTPYGLSIWDIKDNNLKDNSFTKTMDVPVSYALPFDFWHFDIFEDNNVFYCVASAQKATSVFLGKSNDGINFTFWKTPLISNSVTGRTYFYKPSALVHNGIFYLWCPVAELDSVANSTAFHRIWMSQINFNDLLVKLDSE